MRHGAYTSYKNHGCRCPECCRANSEYMRRYRAERPDVRDRNSDLGAARGRALRRLAAQYPRAYERLLTEECAAAHIPRTVKRGRKPS